ncbi:MAG: TonB family protein [Clostridiaceae bacterium]|nr:TonB family protein [Clostridiaceae bacterium]
MKTLIKLLLVLLFLGLTVLYNIGLIDIRLEEIKYLLGTIAAKDDASNTFGVVAKYELIKRRMLYGEENITNYELEARVQALTSSKHLNEHQNTWTVKAYRAPIRLVLNCIRVLQGKKIINPEEDDKIFAILEIAYFYERNRKFTEALKSYEQILANTALSPEIRAAVMVHKAFCLSMLSDYDRSKKVYEETIAMFPNTEAGILSWKLLDFIQSIEREREKLRITALGEMEKARQFYLLMDFRNAIKNLSIFIGKNPKSDDLAEARFFKGRSHEELGEIEEAILEYRRIIKTDKSKIWARQANRRMLMLGAFYEQQKQIAEEAKRQLEAYKDQTFLRNIEKYSYMFSQTSIRGEMQKNENKEITEAPSDDSLLNIINQIGSLDPGSEKKKEKEKQKIEQKKQELLKQGNLNVAEIKELQRRQNLALNPYRRPEALKKVIDDNSGELRYIYNKKLRSGIKISGKMLVEIHIQSSGLVDRARVIQSSIGDNDFEREITQRIISWRFNAVADSLGDLTVNYPFEFFEEQ